MQPISLIYSKQFLDDARYAGRPERQLQGLAAVIESTDPIWRPTVSELIELLQPSDASNGLLVAGGAFGCAKMIQDSFPGPAILLYGASLNAIGSAPDTQLRDEIDQAIDILDRADVSDDDQVKTLVRAAKERAHFDKVSQMLRDEFSAGLLASNKFQASEIPDLAREIVDVTHDVRHKGLVERIRWEHKTERRGGTDTDAGYLVEIDEIEFTDDLLRELLRPARLGSAYSIKSRIDVRRGLLED